MSVDLDIESPQALEDYLRHTGRLSRRERVSSHILTGGVSNRAVWVDLPDRKEAWVLKQALSKLRVTVDWFSDPARIRHEALGILWLARLAPPGCVTPLVFEDAAHHLLAMHAVPQPHENWKTMLMAGRIEPEHVRQFAALLAAIHRNSAESDEALAEIFADSSFFESLRLEPYYSYTAAQVPAAAAFLNELIAATRLRRLALVHGDYSPKNILVHDGRLVLLDHEVIHWGDPAFDLGFALAHFLSKAHRFPDWRDRFIQAALDFRAEYASALGPAHWNQELDSIAARHTLGCLLARVAGRSPLEYLDAACRARQREVVVAMMDRPPAGIEDAVQSFASRIGSQ